MPGQLALEYEKVKKALPYVSLGEFPTPLERLPGLEKELGVTGIYVKRDDKTSSLYGGNKVRKLEFILGEALRKGKKHTITFGYAGSNHSLAVAVFTKRLGMKPISLHLPQANARYVRENLLYQQQLGTEMHHYGGMLSIYAGTMFTILKCFIKDFSIPLIIPPGGSNPMGVVGMFGAMVELREQVGRGLMPVPDYIYVPMGSCGTAAGIALGVAAFGWNTVVRAVKVSEREASSFDTVLRLFDGTAKRMKAVIPSLSAATLGENNFEICEGYLGEGYARFTPEGMSAVELLGRTDGIALEGTYSGKAMAALIDDSRRGLLEGRTTLFWNTHSSVDFDQTIAEVDFRALPKGYHRYFTSGYQPLELPE